MERDVSRGEAGGRAGRAPRASARLEAIVLAAALLVAVPLAARHACGSEGPESGASDPGGPARLTFSLAGALFVDAAPYGVERWMPAVYSKLCLEAGKTLAFSLRPAFLYENSALGLRVPLALDLIFPLSKDKGHTIGPYAGGGFALYEDGGYSFRPLIAAGVDLVFGERFLLALGGDILFKEGDTDVELLVGLGYVFGRRGP